jgi:hypothetical protein
MQRHTMTFDEIERVIGPMVNVELLPDLPVGLPLLVTVARCRQ